MLINGVEQKIEQFANLRGANLRGANLRGADLCGANLRGANLYGANLYGANLRGANLRGADLCGANLRGANLRGADLYGADLYGANLRGANLRGANLYGANLRGAKVDDKTRFTPFAIVPPKGKFLGYKKVTHGGTDVVITLEIPTRAKRVSTPVGRKCRAEYARVLKGHGVSSRGGVYKQGKIYRPDSYDPDWRVECSNGVHFFLTPEEAAAY